MSSVPLPEEHETRTHRIAAVVGSLALGLFIWMPLGALVAFAAAFWIKQRHTPSGCSSSGSRSPWPA